MSFPCAICHNDVRPRQHALECDSCQSWQHRTCGSGVTVLEYRNWTDDQEYICSVCRDAEPEPTEGSVDIEDTETVSDNDVSMVDTIEDSIPSLDDTFIIEQQYNYHSFNVSVEFEEEEEIVESDIEDPDPSDSLIEDQPVKFDIVEDGTNRRAKKLVSSDGYSYTVKKAGVRTTNWRCCIRNKSLWCKATVIQKGNPFVAGPNPHVHPSDPGLIKKTKIKAQAIREASVHVYKSAGVIVQEAIDEVIADNDFNLPNPTYVERSVNRFRQTLRPAEPTDLSFEIDTDFLNCEDFLVGDVTVGTQRHVMFATQQQLDLLKNARRWYLDGTFKVVQKPFTQLFSIHAFVQKDDCVKQVPLCFVLMSSRQKKDYTAVFRRLVQLIPDNRVQAFCLDFESGWHRRFIGKDGGSNLHFYKLVPALMKEARSVGVTVRLVEEHSLCRYQRVTFKKSQGRLAELWDKYEAKTIKTSVFLRSVSNIYATPVPTSQDIVSES